MAVINLDLDNIEEREDRPELPAGSYVCALTTSDVTESQSKAGYYIKAEFTILEGPFRNLKIWDYLNIKNTNEIAERIGLAKFKELAKACGVVSGIVQDTNEIHDIPLVVTLEKRKDKEGNERMNVKKYEALKDARQKTEAKPLTPAAAKPWGQK